MKKRPFAARKEVNDVVATRSVPAGSCVYAVGDIHGTLDLLNSLHRQIEAHASTSTAERKCIVYLGDYIDRGMDSCGVLDLLTRPASPGFERIFLKGNHEDGLLRFLVDSASALSWLAYGGVATIYSYGIKPPDPPTSPEELARVQNELLGKMPRQHLEFLTRLKLYHAEGDYLFVHAGVRPGIPVEAQAPEDLMWIREDFLQSRADFGKLVVHGHSIQAEADVRFNRIGIDTGAFASGRLTCLVLEGESQGLLTT